LPGTVGAVSGFRGTIAEPRHSTAILRAIRGERSPELAEYRDQRKTYLQVVARLIPLLHWRDFELLVDLLFSRAGWVRNSTLGRTLETVDLEVEHPETSERAFVQVKAVANQRSLNEYVRKHSGLRRDYMFFVVHTPGGKLTSLRSDVKIWADAHLAELVVRRGLADWVAERVG
jgi:hypothetical protein